MGFQSVTAQLNNKAIAIIAIVFLNDYQIEIFKIYLKLNG